MRETPRFDGQDQRRADASGRSRFGPEATVSRSELGVRRNAAAFPAWFASLVDQTMRHDLSVSRYGRGGPTGVMTTLAPGSVRVGRRARRFGSWSRA